MSKKLVIDGLDLSRGIEGLPNYRCIAIVEEGIVSLLEDQFQGSARAGQPAVIVPNGYVTLDVFSLPPDAQRFLSAVLSPAFEIGLLATNLSSQKRQKAGQEGHYYQFIDADAALILLDSLLSVWPSLLSHISMDCMDNEADRITRLFDAHQASELTQRRQRRHEEAAAATFPSRKEQEMCQWQDETLVAIGMRPNGRYVVIELPARQIESLISRKSFRSEEAAEAYIADQFSTALVVQEPDITEEIATRKAWQKRQEEAEQAERDSEIPVTEATPGARCDDWPAITTSAVIPTGVSEPEEEER